MQVLARRKRKEEGYTIPAPGPSAQEYRILKSYPLTIPCTTCEEECEMERVYGTRIYHCGRCGALELRNPVSHFP